jgi:quinol monooxygenase YgiN
MSIWHDVMVEWDRRILSQPFAALNERKSHMKPTRIVTLVVLMAASALALHAVGAQQAGSTPANENRKEQANMSNEKVIMLIEAKIQPQRRAELVEAAREYLPLVRAEPGVEAFYITARQDDSNTFVFYEIYRSQAAQDFHLQQDFTKKFLATLKSAQVGDRVRTNLVDLAQEAQAHSK